MGLFHQLCAVGVFAGAKIYATSQSQTYDCLMEYDCSVDKPGVFYDRDTYPLGVSSYVLGAAGTFNTRPLTVEFKNNLDGLIDDLDGEGRKQFAKIDMCVCWSIIDDALRGYELERITENNMARRPFPGVTHLLSRDGHPNPMAVVMLKTVTEMIGSGQIEIPVG